LVRSQEELGNRMKLLEESGEGMEALDSEMRRIKN
jgi:hypothetical protein